MICGTCGEHRTRDEMSVGNPTQCKECIRAYMREWRQRRKGHAADHRRAGLARGRALTRLGKMHPQDYERLVNEERSAEGLPPLGETPLGRPRKAAS